MNRRFLTSINDLQKAADVLAAGNLVAVPTETVYGLAADASQDAAVQKIFLTKGRPSFNPLICHVCNEQMASQLVEIPEIAQKLMNAFWPGPLTIVLPKKPGAPVADRVSAGLETLAVRCPSGPLRKLVELLDRPVAAPSANRSGKISATSYHDVMNEFPNESFPIIDGGECEVGIESTIVKVEGENVILLRRGLISQQQVLEATGVRWSLPEDPSQVQAPGMIKSHYAPEAKLILNFRPECYEDWASKTSSDKMGKSRVGILDFGDQFSGIRCSRIEKRVELSKDQKLEEAARNLYSGLRSLDLAGVDTILVAPIPETGIGYAIADRLTRAAADKPQ